MIDVGWNYYRPLGNTLPDKLGFQPFIPGNSLHLWRDNILLC